MAEKIRASLAEPYRLKVQEDGGLCSMVEHHCTANVGVALFYQHAATQDEIFKHADTAMYQAKSEGRNRVKFCNPGT